MTSRRDFLQQGAAALVASSLPLPARALPGIARARRSPAAPLVDLSRPPDAIVAQTASGLERLGPSAVGGRWGSAHVEVTLAPVEQATRVALAASVGVARVTLRWNADLSPVRLMLGDAWERGYGDLEWRGFVPDRVMPWYVLAFDGARTDGYGVRTGAAAFCWWQMDPEGLTLQADVRSGGVPVTLGARTLNMCELVYWASEDGESPFAALRAFCGVMCPAPRLPSGPVYGHNDWYYAYGGNSAETMRADAAHIVELSPTGGNRPFVVIDDGWQPGRGASKAGAGYWDRGKKSFPTSRGSWPT